MIKNALILLCISVLIAFSCERDDICAASTPTTPQLSLDFRNNDNITEAKSLNIIAYNNTRTDSLVFNSASSIKVPLRTDTTATVYLFVKNPNNLTAAEDPDNTDTLIISYTPQEIFISRACGYKVIFNNLNLQSDPGLDGRWIDDITLNLRTVADEDTTQVFISH